MDDSTVGVSLLTTPTPDYRHLQTPLDELKKWTRCNKVAVNHNETVIMHLNTLTVATPSTVVTLGGNSLQVVKATKLLCVMIDSHHNWKEHGSYLMKSASYQL